jgi:hypothetical protein
VCTLVLIVLAWTGCALPGDECKAKDMRCAGGVLQTCLAYPKGIDGDWNPHHGSPNTWETTANCGAADLCKTTSYTRNSTVLHDAFCTLSPAPDPVCTGVASSTCDGTTAIECNQGYAVARHTCASCQDGTCIGGMNAYCTAPTDCGAGLVCRASSVQSWCDLPCSCPEGAECAACGRGGEADAPGTNGVYKWLCMSGYCFPD